MVVVVAMLSFEACLVPRDRSDPPVEPQAPTKPQGSSRAAEPSVEAPAPVQPTVQATPSPSASSAPPRLEHDPLYQAYAAERRKTHPAGRWQDSPSTKWTDALQRYESRVRPDNQHALNAARRPFAEYLVRMHYRLHVIFAEEFVPWLDTLPASDQRNQPQLNVRIEVATSGTDGRIVHMGIVRSSGTPSFDAAALDVFEQAAPFGPPSANLRSSDGNVYFQWEFHRDPVFACSTINARPYLLSVN
jgi:TonB family protein